jgi:hypothetical protein
LSTIHTNNALATIERLLDMDVERYLLSTALSGIISQRLAKMLCPDCRYQRETTKYEKKVFKKFMNMDVAHVWDANPRGCGHCRRGYHGRIAFHEVLELDEDIRAALSNEKLDKKDLAKMVYTGKTITMLQDALIKCLDGKTSFEEVYRTIEIETEDDDNYEEEVKVVAEQAPKQEEFVPESDDLLESKGEEIKLNIAPVSVNEVPEEAQQVVDQLAPEDQMAAATTPNQTNSVIPAVVGNQPEAAPTQQPAEQQIAPQQVEQQATPQQVEIPSVIPQVIPQATVEDTAAQVETSQPTNVAQSIIPAITEVNPSPAVEAPQAVNPTSIVPEFTPSVVQEEAPQEATAEQPAEATNKPPEIKTFDINKPDDLPKEALLTPIPNITTAEDGNINQENSTQAPLAPRFDKLEKL